MNPEFTPHAEHSVCGASCQDQLTCNGGVYFFVQLAVVKWLLLSAF